MIYTIHTRNIREIATQLIGISSLVAELVGDSAHALRAGGVSGGLVVETLVQVAPLQQLLALQHLQLRLHEVGDVGSSAVVVGVVAAAPALLHLHRSFSLLANVNRTTTSCHPAMKIITLNIF